MEAIIKQPNKLSAIAVTTNFGSTKSIYVPTKDIDTVDMAESPSVYKLYFGKYASCFFTEINTSDCPNIALATPLYDSSLPIPLILLKTSPIYLTINGKIFKYCKIPMMAEITTIGNRVAKKNGSSSPSLAIFPNTKFTPSAA